MAQAKITKRNVDALRTTDADGYLWDTDLKGFGVKVTTSGTKTYIVQYRLGGRGAKTKRYTIGKHGAWTPEKARTEAEEIISVVNKGFDPHRLKIEQQRKLLETDFEKVAFDFIEKYAKPRNRSWREVERIFNLDIIPTFRGRAVSSITRHDVISLIDVVAERGEIMANRVFAHLRKFFNWSVERGLIDATPVAGMRTPFSAVERERVLSTEEIKLAWEATTKLDWPFGPWAQLLLLTGQRRNEVASMRWQDVDMDKAVWTIPSHIAKNGMPHEVPLSPEAIKILKEVPKFECDFVFTTNLKTSISGFSKAKQRIDALMTDALNKQEDTTANEKKKVLAQWCWHDFRRTAATGMASMGYAPHIVEAVLNHKNGVIKGVAAIYNRFDYAKEKREALSSWSKYIISML